VFGFAGSKCISLYRLIRKFFDWNGGSFDVCSMSARFESRPLHQISWFRFIVIFLSFLRHMRWPVCLKRQLPWLVFARRMAHIRIVVYRSFPQFLLANERKTLAEAVTLLTYVREVPKLVTLVHKNNHKFLEKIYSSVQWYAFFQPCRSAELQIAFTWVHSVHYPPPPHLCVWGRKPVCWL
jgi:hypothetical protein